MITRRWFPSLPVRRRAAPAFALLALSACSAAHEPADPGAVEIDDGGVVDASSASPSVAYEPLVCDPAREGDVVFVYHVSDAYFSQYLPHGNALLVIDGSCRYHAFQVPGSDGAGPTPGGTLRSGALTADELAGLNAELLTAPWSAFDGERRNFDTGADSWTVTLRRDALEASCYDRCTGDDALPALTVTATDWLVRLWQRGVPLTGPVDLDAQISMADIADAIAWTGDTQLAPALSGPGFTHMRIDDPEDAAMLRSLRSEAVFVPGPPLHLLEGETLFGIGVADVLPYDIELPSGRAGYPWMY